MRVEYVQCDGCFEGCQIGGIRVEEAFEDGWVLDGPHGDLCPNCADAMALEAEYDVEGAS